MGGRYRMKVRGTAEAPPLPLSLTGTFPSPIVVGEAVNFVPDKAGGVEPYTVTSTGTALPAGLVLNASTGAITGDADGAGTTSGVILTLNDSVGSTPATLALGDIVAVTPAPPADLEVPIHTTDEQFVDITDWLDTIHDNSISVTVAGDVGMRVWGYESLQTDGQTRTWVDRKLREELVAVTRAAAVADGTWTFSAKDGPNETGSLSTYVVTLAVQATPVTITTVGGVLDKAGYGGFPLSRLGSATDWVLETQSDTVNNPLALWFGGTAAAARIAWAGAAYRGTKTVAAPTPGVAAYTATVSSASLGITNRVITFNVDAAICNVAPCPAVGGDSPTVAPLNELVDILRNGTSAGTVVWGLTGLCNEGQFNPTAVNQDWSPKQPTGTAPTSPYGTNASPSWDYADGWNPAWITIKGELPGVVTVEGDAPINQTQIQSGRINVANLTSQILGYRFTNLDLCKGANSSSASLFVRDASFNNRGTHRLAIDHCTRVNIVLNDDGDYSTMFILAYNDTDAGAAGFTASPFSVVARDRQIIGNVFRGYYGDIFNEFGYCSTYGNGRAKRSWNISIDKLLNINVHSDFAQPHANRAAIYNSISLTPAGTPIDLGEFGLGEWSTKGKGLIFTEANVNEIALYLTTSTIVGGPFQLGETITASGGKSMVLDSLFEVTGVSTAYRGNWVGPSVFTAGQTVTGGTSGATATVGTVNYWTGGNVDADDVGKTPADAQGIYAAAPMAPPVTVEHFRNDIPHTYVTLGAIIEGLTTYGLWRLPPPADSADVIIVNNLVTPPWGTISEVGLGGYYDAGRFAPGFGTIFPVQNAISSTVSVGAKIIGRNVFMCGAGFGIGSDDLIGSDFGSPTDAVTGVPTQITDAMVDPGGTATRSSVSDIEQDYSPAPGGILTTQGTPVDFGPIVVEIDYQRHEWDRAALAQL